MPTELSVRNFLKQSELLRKLVQTIRILKSKYFKKVFVITGKEQSSQALLTILFSGEENSMHYVIGAFFGDSEIEIEEKEMRPKNVWSYAQKAGSKHDLAIIQDGSISHEIKISKKTFILPCWVGGVKSFHASDQFTSQNKSDLRRIRRHRFGYRVTTEIQDFDRFYHEMHLPYINNVFGDSAFLMSYEEMKAAIPQCELFFVTQDGQDIAGGIHRYDGAKQVRAWTMGVKDGDRKWVKMGALSALEYFETIYLPEKGYLELHKGASRPFLSDGALRFKLNRGMTITDHTEHSFVLYISNNKLGVCEFLQNNPFFYVDGGKLHAALFIPADKCFDQSMADTLSKKWSASEGVGIHVFSLLKAESGEVTAQLRGKMDKKGKVYDIQ